MGEQKYQRLCVTAGSGLGLYQRLCVTTGFELELYQRLCVTTGSGLGIKYRELSQLTYVGAIPGSTDYQLSTQRLFCIIPSLPFLLLLLFVIIHKSRVRSVRLYCICVRGIFQRLRDLDPVGVNLCVR